MATLEQLTTEEHRAREALEQARSAYHQVSIRYTLAHILRFLLENPEIQELTIDVIYEYDDEGGYFRSFSGWTDAEDDFVFCDLASELDPGAVGDLFGVPDHEIGQGTLTRADVAAKAADSRVTLDGYPYHHAVSSARIYGGTPEDYQTIHDWFDASKEHLADFRHRALRHHTQGIFEAERVFGHTITNSDGRPIPVRWIGEQHVREDLGRIPSAADWLRAIAPQGWMTRGAEPLARQLDVAQR